MEKMKLNPFIKWVGGKRQLISEIEKRLPNNFNDYYEPFVGGGALFMHLENHTTTINDFSIELINVYRVIKNDLDKLIMHLDTLEKEHAKNPKEHYLKIREMDREESYTEQSDIIKAARFIYLNKTCFNGLYRVNKKGFFNVPFNGKEVVNTYEKDNLLNISQYLNKANIRIMNGDFEEAVADAKEGDFIFFDPPYDLLKTDTFDSYTKEGFGVEGQRRLAKVFKELDAKGCYIMLTNHDTPLINELYREYNIDVVQVKRMINRNAKDRKGVETIIYNYNVVDSI